MKKIVSLLIASALVSAAVFAEDVKAELTFVPKGSVTTTWGVDLDTGFTGFKMASDLTMHVESNKQDYVKDGEGFYGEVGIGAARIQVGELASGVSAHGDADTLWLAVDGLWGKIVLDKLTVNMKSGWTSNGTTIETSYFGASGWYGALTNAYAYSIFDGAYGNGANASNAFGLSWEDDGAAKYFKVDGGAGVTYSAAGTGIGLKYEITDVANISVDFASNGDWTANSGNDYAVGFGLELTAVEGLTLNAGVFYDTWAAEYVKFGAKVGYDIKAGDDVKIIPYVAYGAEFTDGGIGVLGGGIRAEVFKSILTAYTSVGVASADHLNVTVSLDMKSVENLTLQGSVELVDPSQAVTNDNTMQAHAKLGYAIKADDKVTITPSAQFSLSDNGAADDEYYAKAGVEVTGLLANTTFNLGWDSNDLNAATNKMGQLLISAKVSF